MPAIEAAIFAGVPINVTLLFSREQYIAAAEAYLRGVERRIEAGLNPAVASVASLFISRWDVAISGKAPGELSNRLGIAIAQRTYKAYLELLASRRFQRAANAGARSQRLLWASTGTKDPKAPDTLYVKALAAPFTINTMPGNTLKAFADHGEVGELLASDGGDCGAGAFHPLPAASHAVRLGAAAVVRPVRRQLPGMRWAPRRRVPNGARLRRGALYPRLAIVLARPARLCCATGAARRPTGQRPGESRAGLTHCDGGKSHPPKAPRNRTSARVREVARRAKGRPAGARRATVTLWRPASYGRVLRPHTVSAAVARRALATSTGVVYGVPDRL